MNIQKSELVRIIKFAIGGFAIVFSAYRLFNITTVIPFPLTHPGIAVLVIGIVDIVRGVLGKSDSKITRTIWIGIGIIAIIVGLFVMVGPTDLSSRTTWFLFLFVIIHGAGFVLTGITKGGKAKAIRISKIVIGVTLIAVTGLLFEYGDLSETMISILLSINLLVIGIELFIGATSQKLAKKPNHK